jgi:hypothetical protein
MKRNELLSLYNLFPVKLERREAKKQIFAYIDEKIMQDFDLASLKVFCDNFKSEFKFLPSYAEGKKFVDDFVFKFKPATRVSNAKQKDIWDKVEENIVDFLQSHKELCSQAKEEKWLGYQIKKCHRGLLGYMRTSFALQIRLLENSSCLVPIYQTESEILWFFRSSWFKDTTMQNGFVKPIYKKEHFELIK